MDGRAIGAGALARAGLGMLTTDIGRTRLAEIMRAKGEGRTAGTERSGAARAGRPDPARATRP